VVVQGPLGVPSRPCDLLGRGPREPLLAHHARSRLDQALSHGHSVVALARRPDDIALQHARLAVVKGDVLDAHSLGPACDGVDAVISALGIGASRAPTRVYSDGIRHILTAMQAHCR